MSLKLSKRVTSVGVACFLVLVLVFAISTLSGNAEPQISSGNVDELSAIVIDHSGSIRNTWGVFRQTIHEKIKEHFPESECHFFPNQNRPETVHDIACKNLNYSGFDVNTQYTPLLEFVNLYSKENIFPKRSMLFITDGLDDVKGFGERKVEDKQIIDLFHDQRMACQLTICRMNSNSKVLVLAFSYLSDKNKERIERFTNSLNLKCDTQKAPATDVELPKDLQNAQLDIKLKFKECQGGKEFSSTSFYQLDMGLPSWYFTEITSSTANRNIIDFQCKKISANIKWKDDKVMNSQSPALYTIGWFYSPAENNPNSTLLGKNASWNQCKLAVDDAYSRPIGISCETEVPLTGVTGGLTSYAYRIAFSKTPSPQSESDLIMPYWYIGIASSQVELRRIVNESAGQ